MDQTRIKCVSVVVALRAEQGLYKALKKEIGIFLGIIPKPVDPSPPQWANLGGEAT